MTDRELMRQVLDALDSDNPDIQLRTAITLRNRMSQPEPLFSTPDVTPEVTPHVIDCPRCGHCCPQPNQEPVAWRFGSGTWLNQEIHWRYIDTLEGAEGLRGLEPLYTTPPQRQWVGLTREDMAELRRAGLHSISDKEFEVIANFLKEKNGG